MDSIVSWLILTGLSLAGIAWLLISRVKYLDSVHITKVSCVRPNAGHKQDWQQFATGHHR